MNKLIKSIYRIVGEYRVVFTFYYYFEENSTMVKSHTVELRVTCSMRQLTRRKRKVKKNEYD